MRSDEDLLVSASVIQLCRRSPAELSIISVPCLLNLTTLGLRLIECPTYHKVLEIQQTLTKFRRMELQIKKDSPQDLEWQQLKTAMAY